MSSEGGGIMPATECSGKTRVLVVGPYGGTNIGDELILHQILQSLHERKCEPIVTTHNREHTMRYHGVSSVPVLEYRRGQRECIGAVSGVDTVIVGGGEQLVEPRLPNPIWGPLAQVAHVARHATKQRRGLFFWAVGVGDRWSPVGRWMLRRWIRPAASGTVRDGQSHRRLLQFGVAEDQVVVSADPVFLTRRVERRQGRELLETLLGETLGARPVILLVPANDKLRRLTYVDPLVSGCLMAARASGARIAVQITDLQPNYDRILLRHPALQGNDILRWLPVRHYVPSEMALIYAGTDAVISSRMHPLILACTQGTPWVSVARSNKMLALSESLGMPTELRPSTLQPGHLSTRVQETLRSDRDVWDEALAPRLEEMRSRARMTTQLFDRHLARGRTGKGATEHVAAG